MLHMKACWNPKGGHKPCLCEGVAGLRPATPSQKHGLYWLYHMWFFFGWKCILPTILENSRSVHSWYMVPKNHAGIGSHWRSDPRDGQISERGPHPHYHRRRKSTDIVAIGGYGRILWVPTRCPQGVVLTSKKRCQPCVVSRIKRIKLITKIGGQSSSSSWWQWQDSWWHPSSETSPRRWT